MTCYQAGRLLYKTIGDVYYIRATTPIVLLFLLYFMKYYRGGFHYYNVF